MYQAPPTLSYGRSPDVHGNLSHYPSSTLNQADMFNQEIHTQSMLISGELFLLLTATTLTRQLVTRFNARAKLFSPRQERNVFSGPAVVFLKGYTGFVAAKAFYTTSNSSLSTLTYRFNMWLPMCFGYAFELAHRSLSFGLICHHAGSQVATYLFWSSALFQSPPVMFALSEMFLAILIFGVGIHGSAAEILDLIRHLAPKESKTAQWVMKATAQFVWLSFTCQWTTILKLVLMHSTCLRMDLTVFEQAGWLLCFLLFFWTQIGSIRSMNAVAKRFSHSLDCKAAIVSQSPKPLKKRVLSGIEMGGRTWWGWGQEKCSKATDNLLSGTASGMN